MPILYSFYNQGNTRMAVTDEDVLVSWKEFFDTDMNWKDFSESISYQQYKEMTDSIYIKQKLCRFGF